MSGNLIWAHRGRNRVAPENTMAAFRAAFDFGDAAIELDVTLSSDGELIVIHDDSVDRTTNGTGVVSDMSLLQLKDLDAGSWFHPRFSNERLPLLSEVLNEARGRALVNIEIKHSAWRENAGEGIELPVLELVKKKDMIDGVLISGFDWRSLSRIRVYDRDISLGVLAASGWNPEAVAEFAAEIAAFSIHPDKADLLDGMPEMYRKFAGFVYPYTVGDAAAGESLTEKGADGFFADLPFDVSDF